jgi:hypothetical protein
MAREGHWSKLRPTRTCIGAWLDRRWPWALYPWVHVASRSGGTWHAGTAGCGVIGGGVGESQRGPGKVVAVVVAAQPSTAGGDLATHAAAAMGDSTAAVAQSTAPSSGKPGKCTRGTERNETEAMVPAVKHGDKMEWWNQWWTSSS